MLKRIVLLLILVLTGYAVGLSQTQMLQLRIYHFENEQQMEVTENFLENIYLPKMKSKGFTNIGVFKNHKSNDSTLNLYVLLPIKTVRDLHNFDEENVGLFPPVKHYSRVENIIISAFEDMPKLRPTVLTSPRDERIYELRSYESVNDMKYKNKVDMFNSGGEILLFDKLGFNAVFYGEVIAGSKMPNLMYMTTHESQEARDENWKNFIEAPEWKTMSSLPKYQKNVSHIDIYFLYPTSYSDY